MFWLFILALILLFLGGWALFHSTRLRQDSGLPVGRLVYADSADWQPTPRSFYSPTYQLVGKPDYLVETAAGIIPVEVKSSRAPTIPYMGHLLQLAAYCLLVEETTGRTPPNGLLKYADALYEVDFTQELRRELLATLADMRQSHLDESVNRSHQQPGKCAVCGFGYMCDEVLVE